MVDFFCYHSLTCFLLYDIPLGVPTTMKAKTWAQLWSHRMWVDSTKWHIDDILIGEVRIEDIDDFRTVDDLDRKSDHRGVA